MVVLFPLSYPYKIGQEETFLSAEVSQLNNNFNEFVIFPTVIGTEKFKIDPTIYINTQLAQHGAYSRFRFNVLFNSSFYKLFFVEVFHQPLILLHFKKIKKMIGFILNTIQTENWIKNVFIKNIDIKNGKEIVLYTFWFTHITTALCCVFKTNKHIKIITRAHGIDLFEDRNDNYIPLREYTINLLDKLYFVSDFGKAYALKKYPKHKIKYKTFPLGVASHGFINKLSNKLNNEFYFVSCSNVDANKRVGLIFESLYFFAAKNPEKKIHWTHFGSGPLLQDLIKMVNNHKNSNLIVKLKGYQSNDDIFDYYRQEPINAFITTTSSEGGRPISIQEALSFGIPVIATRVGGVPELINESNGFLLSENPELNEIIAALSKVVFEYKKWNEKRELCYKIWNEKCNALKLTNNFVNEIKKIGLK